MNAWLLVVECTGTIMLVFGVLVALQYMDSHLWVSKPLSPVEKLGCMLVVFGAVFVITSIVLSYLLAPIPDPL